MKPYKHQIDKAEECWDILKQVGYVYLAGKPRSGKTLTSLLIAEKSQKVNNVLVITKKAAISGWDKFLADKELGLTKKYHVINYEQLGKMQAGRFYLKVNPSDYQLAIIDESHNLGTLGKPSQRTKVIRKVCWDLPHIHLSGTAIVESPNTIYHQMAISKFNPFKFSNFYDFFRFYGIPYYIKVNGREIAQYDRCDTKRLMKEINAFTVYMTQEDAGISSDIQSVDKLHYVELDNYTRDFYNRLQNVKVISDFSYYNGAKSGLDIVCDSTMKLRTSLHMVESGILKIGDDYIELGNTEKIDYIKKTFGDTKDVGIMCHFIGERNLLKKHFKNARIYSSNAHAEGVDLSDLKHFIILSSDYSGAKFIQRRDRIVNINGSNTNLVNHILVKKAISEQVYNKVSKKEDFNNSTYIKQEI